MRNLLEQMGKVIEMFVEQILHCWFIGSKTDMSYKHASPKSVSQTKKPQIE